MAMSGIEGKYIFAVSGENNPAKETIPTMACFCRVVKTEYAAGIKVEVVVISAPPSSA